MATVKIHAGFPFDGEYPFDMSFDYNDFRDINMIAKLRANEVQEALEAGNTDLHIAFTSIALRRAGVTHDPETLFTAKIGTIELDFTDGEDVDEDPPMRDSETQTSGSNGASGTDTKTDMDTSPETSVQSVSGIPQPDSSYDLKTSGS